MKLIFCSIYRQFLLYLFIFFIIYLKLPQSPLFYFSLLLPVNSPSTPKDRLAVIHEFNRHEGSYEAGIKLRCSMDCCHEHIKEHVVLLTANPDPLLLAGSLNWFCLGSACPQPRRMIAPFFSANAYSCISNFSSVRLISIKYIREILRKIFPLKKNAPLFSLPFLH